MEHSDEEIKEGLEAVFTGLFAGMEKETRDNYGELINNVRKVNSPEDYHFTYLHPLESALRETIRLKVPDINAENLSNVVCLYTKHRYIKDNFEKVICKVEGMPCSADKSRWLVRQLWGYFAKGKEIDMSTEGKEYTFMIPKFWNENKGQEWLEFFKALICLYHGNMDYYIKFLQDYYVPLVKELSPTENTNNRRTGK